MIQLTEHHLEDLSDLKYQIFTCPFKQPSATGAMIVKFTGIYGMGSCGNDDAGFMTAIAKAALAGWRSRALVIDLQEMEYEWGDSISQVLDAGVNRYNRPFPTALVVSEANREALSGLLRFMDKEPADWVFDSLDAAMEKLERQCFGSE